MFYLIILIFFFCLSVFSTSSECEEFFISWKFLRIEKFRSFFQDACTKLYFFFNRRLLAYPSNNFYGMRLKLVQDFLTIFLEVYLYLLVFIINRANNIFKRSINSILLSHLNYILMQKTLQKILYV